ncbi:hypothetical protein ABVK25_001783 [Lepraria finkii]|uniref:Uncharacterized protein n=1 Tax=Lepraria finkii TaxID=1340010 RepID=A0ABR4BKA2_9LECA
MPRTQHQGTQTQNQSTNPHNSSNAPNTQFTYRIPNTPYILYLFEIGEIIPFDPLQDVYWTLINYVQDEVDAGLPSTVPPILTP